MNGHFVCSVLPVTINFPSMLDGNTCEDGDDVKDADENGDLNAENGDKKEKKGYNEHDHHFIWVYQNSAMSYND